MIKGTAIVLTNGWLKNIHAKTAHGLLRGSQRFQILSLIDPVYSGRDAGEVLNGKPMGIPIISNVKESLTIIPQKPKYCIVGVALHGGKMPDSLRSEIIEAMRNGLSVVCGLHTYLSEDPELQQVSAESQVEIIDVRKPRMIKDLQFWTGEIYKIDTPRIALLGTDCASGKRTTGKMILEICQKNGIKTEMIYTGQTGWMQGFKHGFMFDATANDFIGGEIERVIIECVKESNPDLILIEGQGSLQNPSGPCGSEFLLSGNVKAVILQHTPGRKYFDGFDHLRREIPAPQQEIELIKFYGAETLAVTLSEEGLNNGEMREYQNELSKKNSIPVVRPMKQGVESLLPIIQKYIDKMYVEIT
jgi:uncharacterized NAD-dependent epimerase/dehydratase family protein